MLCIGMYVSDVQSKTTRSDVEPRIVKHTAATALIDGNNALGPVSTFLSLTSITHSRIGLLNLQVIGKLCMDTAISKAKNVGIGWVVCSGEIGGIILLV